MIYWLKSKKNKHSSLGGSKITYLGKSLFPSAFGFSNSCTLYHCAIFNSLNAGFFSIPSGCQTIRIEIRPDNLSGLTWVQTVCKGY